MQVIWHNIRYAWWLLKKPFCVRLVVSTKVGLTSESVEGSALSFQSIDDIHSSDGLSFGMFGVGDSITDDIFEEDLEYSSSFFVDES